MWLAFSTNWTAEPVFSKRLEMPCKKSSRWKRRFSGVLSALSIDRMYSVSCHPLNRSPFERRARPTPVPKTKVAPQGQSFRLPSLASAKPAASPSLRTVTGTWNVCSSLLARGMPRKYGMRPPRKTKPRLFWISPGHEMAIPSISSLTGVTISSNPCQNSSIVGGVGILSVWTNW